jgi:hypothetical protein
MKDNVRCSLLFIFSIFGCLVLTVFFDKNVTNYHHYYHHHHSHHHQNGNMTGPHASDGIQIYGW